MYRRMCKEEGSLNGVGTYDMTCRGSAYLREAIGPGCVAGGGVIWQAHKICANLHMLLSILENVARESLTTPAQNAVENEIRWEECAKRIYQC